METIKKSAGLISWNVLYTKNCLQKYRKNMPGSDISAEPFFWMTSQKKKKSSLAVFFRKIFPGRKMCGSRQNKWKRHCKAARFCNFTWEEILELYTGRALLVKKEEKQKEEQKRESWFQNIQLQLKNPDFRNWISEVLQNRKESYLFLLQQYKENKKELEDFLQKTDQGQQKQLAASEKRELLAVFAAESHRKSTLF